MLRTRRALLAVALVLCGSALAGAWGVDWPKLTDHPRSQLTLATPIRPSLHPQVNPAPRPGPRAAARLSGPIHAVHAVDLAGLETELPIPPGLDLSDPLPVSPDAVELLIELDGSVTVTGSLKDGGSFLQRYALDELRVVLDDPDQAAADGEVLLSPPDLDQPAGEIEAELSQGLIGR